MYIFDILLIYETTKEVGMRLIINATVGLGNVSVDDGPSTYFVVDLVFIIPSCTKVNLLVIFTVSNSGREFPVCHVALLDQCLCDRAPRSLDFCHNIYYVVIISYL